METWYLFITFEQEVLMKYNTENMSQRQFTFEIVTWFPNFWVRKYFVVKEKWINYDCFQDSDVKYSIQFINKA
jgi:hypothetical protein